MTNLSALLWPGLSVLCALSKQAEEVIPRSYICSTHKHKCQQQATTLPTRQECNEIRVKDFCWRQSCFSLKKNYTFRKLYLYFLTYLSSWHCLFSVLTQSSVWNHFSSAWKVFFDIAYKAYLGKWNLWIVIYLRICLICLDSWRSSLHLKYLVQVLLSILKIK